DYLMPQQPPEPKHSAARDQSDQAVQGNQPDHPAQRTGFSGQRRAWRDLVEERIATAREQGEFDNLRGAGQPLRRDDFSLAGEKALAYHLLKNNDMTPPEIERGQEIDAMLERANELLATLRHRRDTLLARGKYAYASDRRAYNILREKTERRYAGELRAINSRILSLNIIAPPALHRPLIAVEERLRAFADEFPRMAE
ncbi:MAG TPA: DnaJ family domain-containing protein, partial [Ktedonobacterales bacterium]|nr:DnaJ family domain-containing protein [Ktedonobacterales bacterium]